jgi:hypothetical protein
VRAIDKRRICRVFGELRHEEVAAVDEGLASFLGLLPPRQINPLV